MSHQATLSGFGERASITVAGLDSESEATEYLACLASGLMWTAVEMACSVVVSTELEELTYSETPVEAGNPNGIPAPVPTTSAMMARAFTRMAPSRSSLSSGLRLSLDRMPPSASPLSLQRASRCQEGI